MTDNNGTKLTADEMLLKCFNVTFDETDPIFTQLSYVLPPEENGDGEEEIETLLIFHLDNEHITFTEDISFTLQGLEAIKAKCTELGWEVT